MNFIDIFYTGPEHIVAGYQGNYKLSPGKVTVESWMADILIIRGYGLALKPAKGVESYERRNKKQSRKVSAGHKESIQERGELKCSP